MCKCVCVCLCVCVLLHTVVIVLVVVLVEERVSLQLMQCLEVIVNLQNVTGY